MSAEASFYEIPRVVTIRSIYTAFHIHYDESFYFEGEAHNFWELAFISEGRAGVAKDEKIFNLSAGDIAFHRPMEFHRLWSVGEPFRVLVISFVAEGTLLDRLANGIFTLNLTQRNALLELLQEIDNAFIKKGIFLSSQGESPISVQLAANRLELFLLDLLKLESPEKRADTSRTAQEFTHIIEVMHEHIHQNLTVPELAQLSNLSVSNLKRICQRYAATGPGKHFMRLKMIRAMQLLQQGLSVSEASEQLGFSGANYFSYVFRRETGQSPMGYKHSISENAVK